MPEPVKPHHLVSEPEKTRQILAAKFKGLDLQEHDLIEEECEAPAEGHKMSALPMSDGLDFNPKEISNNFAFNRTWWCEWEYWWLLFLLIGMLIIGIHLLLVYY